jgi:hypothetical protein
MTIYFKETEHGKVDWLRIAQDGSQQQASSSLEVQHIFE